MLKPEPPDLPGLGFLGAKLVCNMLSEVPTPSGRTPTNHREQHGSLAVAHTDPTFQSHNSESLDALRALKDAKEPINHLSSFFSLGCHSLSRMRVRVGLRGNVQRSDDMGIRRTSLTR
jgi:hypothetical protein